MRLNPLLKTHLKKFAARGLYIDVVADWEELHDLNELARKVTSPASQAEAVALINAPVTRGNMILQRPTVGVFIWAEERLKAWFSNRPVRFRLAEAYALAHAKTPGRCWKFRDADDCWRAVKMWARRLNVTFDEISEAVEEACGIGREEMAEQAQKLQTDDKSAKDKASEFGPVVSLLCREYGESPDYWIWHASMEMVTSFLDEYNARIRAEERANAAGQGRVIAPDTSTAYAKACNDLRVAVNSYRDMLQCRMEDAEEKVLA